MSKVLIEEQYLHDIADSIRKMHPHNHFITTDSMAREIEQCEIVYDPEEHWERPIEWPDYSQIDISNFEGMYFTYRATDTTHYDNWIGVYCVCAGGYKVQRGQIRDGEFVVESSVNVNSGAEYRAWIEPTITGYVVYRIIPQVAGNAITSIGMRNLNTALSKTTRTRRHSLQQIVERYGRLPNVTAFSNWSNFSVESDTIRDLKKITTMGAVWNSCFKIQNIDITGFDSEPTSCSQTFCECRRLKYLNSIQRLVTSKCTTMYCMFQNCNQLKFIDCGEWDTSNVTNMSSVFYCCFNLYKADVSNWNVSKVTNIAYLFCNCNKLPVIDVSNWVVTLPTSYYCLFANCTRVEHLDLKGFDTTNVTSMYQTFYQCISLKELDVSHFNTSKVTSFSQTFYCLRDLRYLDVSNFDTSKATNMSYMFAATCNVEELDLSNFDFSVCTNITQLLNSAAVTGHVILPHMTTGKLGSNYLNSAFASNLSLKSIDLSDVNCTGVTSTDSVFRYCYSLEEVTLPTTLKVIGPYFFDSCEVLETVVIPYEGVATLSNVNAFSGATRDKNIYVPDNLVASYQTANNWKSLSHVTFKGISELE